MEQVLDTIEFKAVSEPDNNSVTINETVKIYHFPLGSRNSLGSPSTNKPQVSYPMFVPEGREKFSKAIVLLFGLREQANFPSSAFRLATSAKRPVILFPISKDTVNLLDSLMEQLEKGLDPIIEKGAFTDVFVFSQGEHLQRIIDISNQQKFAAHTKLHVLCEGAGVTDINEVTQLLIPESNTQKKKNWAELINADI